jgi:hypothetical protein
MSDVPTVNGKPWWKSKTIWFNLICTGLFAAEVNFKVLEGLIPGAAYSALAFVLPVGNMLLRFITSTALITPRVDQPAMPVPPSQAGFISALAMKSLGTVAVLAFALWLVFDAGRDVNEAKWLKKESAQLAVDQQERDRIAKLGQHAAAYEIQEQTRAAERQAHLTGVMNHARKQFRLLANVGASGALRGNGLGARDGVACALAQGQDSAPPDLGVGDDPHAVLTLGAVWLWNAALAGQADLAAAACRVDAATGQADPACSQSSGLDLDAAFANHAANAASCAADRARHQRLIEYLKKLEQQP